MINTFITQDGDTSAVVDDSTVVFHTQEEDVHVFETPSAVQDEVTPETERIIFNTQDEVVHTFETSPPRGEKGDPGAAAGQIVYYPVAYPMSGHRIVVLNENQEAIYASSAIPIHANKVLGMTIGAVSFGNIGIQNSGILTESSWNWILDIPIWLGVDGLLAQFPPTTGFCLIVGFPISLTSIFIDIREPIFLI